MKKAMGLLTRFLAGQQVYMAYLFHRSGPFNTLFLNIIPVSGLRRKRKNQDVSPDSDIVTL